MAYSTIPKGSLYMNNVLYTGNGSTNNITGVGFQPDWVWLKKKNSAANHYLTDAVRGVTKDVSSNTNFAEDTHSNGLTAFGSDGFSLGDNSGFNGNSDTFVAWNWKANGQGSSNTDGSTNTIYTSVNTTSKFSISSYTGTGVAGATIGHGLGVIPKMIFVKVTNTTNNWGVYHASLGSGSPQNKYLILDANNTQEDATTLWNDTAPTDQVFSVGSGGMTNLNGNTYISYAFSDVKGYSKFGSYTGASSNLPFIYTGFKPAFLLIKKATGSVNNWYMFDSATSPSNVVIKYLTADTNDIENTSSNSQDLDLLSNGFKIRNTNNGGNTNAETYIYMAFAENPFVATSGASAVPVTAR